MDSKIRQYDENERTGDDGGETRPMLRITECLSEIGGKILHPIDAMFGPSPCEHEWAPVRMVKFAGADSSSEVMRCLKCGSVDIVERKSA